MGAGGEPDVPSLSILWGIWYPSRHPGWKDAVSPRVVYEAHRRAGESLWMR